MFTNLYDFFFNTVFGSMRISVSGGTSNPTINLFGLSGITLQAYFSYLCALASNIFILVLCALFVYKIIKLVGGLISR